MQDEECGSVAEVKALLRLGSSGELSPSSFLLSCPTILNYLLNHSLPGCYQYPLDPLPAQPVLVRPDLPPGSVKDFPDDSRTRPYRVDPNSRYGSRSPGYDPRNPNYDPRERKDFEARRRNNEDRRGRGYDRRGPKYDPKDPRYDPKDPRYDPKNPRYDPKDPRYDPKNPRNRSGPYKNRDRYNNRGRYPYDRDPRMRGQKRYDLNRRGYGDQYPKRYPGAEQYDYDYEEEFRPLDGKESIYGE